METENGFLPDRKITFLLTGTVKSIIDLSRSIACLNNVGPIH